MSVHTLVQHSRGKRLVRDTLFKRTSLQAFQVS